MAKRKPMTAHQMKATGQVEVAEKSDLRKAIEAAPKIWVQVTFKGDANKCGYIMNRRVFDGDVIQIPENLFSHKWMKKVEGAYAEQSDNMRPEVGHDDEEI